MTIDPRIPIMADGSSQIFIDEADTARTKHEAP